MVYSIHLFTNCMYSSLTIIMIALSFLMRRPMTT